MKISIKLGVALLVVSGIFNISAYLYTVSPDKSKALVRKWKYVMIKVPSVREMLEHVSYEEREKIINQYAKALKGAYLKFNADNTFEIRKTPKATPTKGTWRFDKDDNNKLYMKQAHETKEQATYIQKLNRKQLVITNGKNSEAELVQIYLEPFE
ncbi:hypothetical protein [Microscilla marina]|uniref:Uncharacterized protein n=1 Tax=Microscilla marina ATCC 23134 TaxID=313606 RepID=A1ZP98_MICM2|nr:hypothetical protein [Microscilla marina]EAY27890.1 hypothetical protein M23134_00331 [Microscilla marina ATCC 23134]